MAGAFKPVGGLQSPCEEQPSRAHVGNLYPFLIWRDSEELLYSPILQSLLWSSFSFSKKRCLAHYAFIRNPQARSILAF